MREKTKITQTSRIPLVVSFHAVQLHPDNDWGIVVEDASDGAVDSLVYLRLLAIACHGNYSVACSIWGSGLKIFLLCCAFKSLVTLKALETIYKVSPISVLVCFGVHSSQPLFCWALLCSVGSFSFWVLWFVSSIIEISLRQIRGQHLFKVQEAPKDEVVDTQVQAVGAKQNWDFWFKHVQTQHAIASLVRVLWPNHDP